MVWYNLFMERIRKKTKQFVDFSVGSQVAIILILEIFLGAAFTLFAIGVFRELAEKVMSRQVIFFDAGITTFVTSLRSPILTNIMLFITFLGSELFLDIIIVITILLLFRKHKKDALIFSFILFITVTLELYLKSFFQRQRPEFVILDNFPIIFEKTFSFPSGHAMNSFVFYTCCAYFIFRKIKNKKIGYTLVGLSGALIFLIGLSRIYLGVHYPSDVLAGFAAGFVCFTVVLLFEKTIQFLQLFRKYEFEKGYEVKA